MYGARVSNNILGRFLGGFLGFCFCLGEVSGEPVLRVSRDGGVCELEWVGEAGVVYFVQSSVDLKNWGYLPVVQGGDGSVIRYGFACERDAVFVRLQYVKAATGDPDREDFDGDGISNWDEIRVGGTGTNPLKEDSDDDGIRDDGLVYAAQNDPDGAYLTEGLREGLRARWDIQPAPGNFTTYQDFSGNGHHLARNFIVGTDTVNAIISQSCVFSGGYLETNAAVLGGADEFSLSFWMKPSDGSLTVARPLWSYSDSVTAPPSLSLFMENSNTVKLRTYTSANSFQDIATWTTTENLDDGEWRHVALVRRDGNPTGTRYHLLINGQVVGNDWGGGNYSFPGTTQGYIRFGATTTLPTSHRYLGHLDRILLHGRALSNAETMSLYHADIDGDGLWDITEHRSLLWRDGNGDGVRQFNESSYFISPFHFDAADSDHDGDGRTSLAEQNDTQHPTNPFNPDSDGDLLPDGWEVANGLNPNNPFDGSVTADSDNDGATNRDEYAFGSDPTNGVNGDTDGDGTSDADEIAQGSHPGDARDGGQPLPSEERLSILLGVGDESGSESEDYVLNVYRINPDTGEEERYFTLRSGGHGEYAEGVFGFFRKSDTYTFQIDWQSSNQGSSSGGSPDGADFDYTFKVEPLNDSTGILIDSYDPVGQTVDTTTPIGGERSDVQDFQETVERKRMLFLQTEIVPDDGQTGKTGGQVLSNKGASGEKHYVSPRKNNAIPDEFVVLKTKGVSKQIFQHAFEWEGGEAVPNAPHKRKIKRDTTGKRAVKLKARITGREIDRMNIWVVWANGRKVADRPLVTRRGNSIITGDGTMGPGIIMTGGYDFKFSIVPDALIKDAERPALDGPNQSEGIKIDPPGSGTNHFASGRDLKGGVVRKWDVSRRVRTKVLNPHLYGKDKLDFVLGTLWVKQPIAEDTPAVFPADGRTGNDDAGVLDEGNNPYAVLQEAHLAHAIGEISSTDSPNQLLRDSTGADGDTFVLKHQFGEFSRLLIGGKWYRISDYLDWRAHFKLKREEGVWVDDGSSIAMDNDNF